jgi:hypothetical protein
VYEMTGLEGFEWCADCFVCSVIPLSTAAGEWDDFDLTSSFIEYRDWWGFEWWTHGMRVRLWWKSRDWRRFEWMK